MSKGTGPFKAGNVDNPAEVSVAPVPSRTPDAASVRPIEGEG